VQRKLFQYLAATLLIAFITASAADASITIEFSFSGGLVGDDANTVANRQAFDDAADFWEGIITGYVDGSTRTVSIEASTFQAAASGGFIELGNAGPTTLAPLGQPLDGSGTSFFVPVEGVANFNTDPQATNDGLLDPTTIRHELGHILGIGTIWDDSEQSVSFNEIDYVEGSGQYFGENALEAYRNEFDPTASFVPIELQGGEGTANAHWDQVPGGGLTVLSGPNQGESFNNELLTGFRSGSNFLSDTTIGGLRDLGYTTIAFRAVAIPEPGSFVLLSCVVFFSAVRRRSRCCVLPA
jgi:hypothetical protein